MTEQPKEKPPTVSDNQAFVAWLETVPDPERRYKFATTAMSEYQEMVSRLSALRADAVADASEAEPVSSVAQRLGVSRQRAYQLLKEAKAGGKSSNKRAEEPPERKE
jgi:predicted transcriptional regulator YheO